MKNLFLTTLITIFLSCNKDIHENIVENAKLLSEIKELSVPVDAEVISQYQYSSISDEFKSISITAKFFNEDENAEVSVNGLVLDKNKNDAKRHRHIEVQNFERFNSMFKDKSGQRFPLKISKSSLIADFSTDFYLPRVGKFESMYNIKAKELDLKWAYDNAVGNNIMIVSLAFKGKNSESHVTNYNFPLNSQSAKINIGSESNVPKDLELILISYTYGTAKIVESIEGKKIRCISIVHNQDVVYNREKGN